MPCRGSNTHQFIRHIRRVFGYARNSDYALAGGMAATSPLAFWAMEKLSPSGIGRGGFSPIMRLAATIGIVGGLHVLYQRSASTSFFSTSLSPASSLALETYICLQTVSTDSPRTRGKLRWICARWLTRSRRVSLFTVSPRCLLTCRVLLPVTPVTPRCSSTLSPGPTSPTTTR